MQAILTSILVKLAAKILTYLIDKGIDGTKLVIATKSFEKKVEKKDIEAINDKFKNL